MEQISYLKSENGATAIEYALIATGVSIAIAASVYAFGDEMVILYSSLVGLLAG